MRVRKPRQVTQPNFGVWSFRSVVPVGTRVFHAGCTRATKAGWRLFFAVERSKPACRLSRVSREAVRETNRRDPFPECRRFVSVIAGILTYASSCLFLLEEKYVPLSISLSDCKAILPLLGACTADQSAIIQHKTLFRTDFVQP